MEQQALNINQVQIIINKYNCLIRAIRCFISERNCDGHSSCIPIIDIFIHWRQCRFTTDCPYVGCIQTLKLIKHYVRCSRPNCFCLCQGEKSPDDPILIYMKELVNKNLFYIWYRKVDLFRGELVSNLTSYMCEAVRSGGSGSFNEGLQDKLEEHVRLIEADVYGGCDSTEKYFMVMAQRSRDLLGRMTGGRCGETATGAEARLALQNSRVCQILRDFNTRVMSSQTPNHAQPQNNSTAAMTVSSEATAAVAPAVISVKTEMALTHNSPVIMAVTHIHTPLRDERKDISEDEMLNGAGGAVEEERELKENIKPEQKSVVLPGMVAASVRPKREPDMMAGGAGEGCNSQDEEESVRRWTKTEMQELWLPLHRRIWDNPDARIFHEAVDWRTLGIPDYPLVVRQPMDMSTIRARLQDGSYQDPWQVVDDFWLMFNNAWLYNKRARKVHRMCTNVAEIFDKAADELMRSIGLCCSHEYVYLPQVLICCTPGMCYVERDCVYYQLDNREPAAGLCLGQQQETSADAAAGVGGVTSRPVKELAPDKYVCCDKCFQEATSGMIQLMVSESAATLVAVPKSQFERQKNNVKEPEEMVRCGRCRIRWHRVCAGHLDEMWRLGWLCPHCRTSQSAPNPFRAATLPHTVLGRHLEAAVDDWRLQQSSSNATAKVHVRVLTSARKQTEVKPLMHTRYVETGEMPDKLPYSLRSVYAFQEQEDGSEICLFGMQTQEYGHDCPEPNRGRVYLAYLDSVQYFFPASLRTAFYHCLLTAYLQYCGSRLGLAYAHIWACPPSDGDDYIFHAHPQHQKLPKPRRLQDWYSVLLGRACASGSIIGYDDLVRHAASVHIFSIAELPYFEGDYWPSVLEDMLRDETTAASVAASPGEENESSPRSSPAAQQHQKQQQQAGLPKKRKMKQHTGSGPGSRRKMTDGSCAAASSASGSPDSLSRRMLELLEKRRENFFVVQLVKPHDASDAGTRDPDPVGFSELMDGRDRFLSLARDRHLEFSSVRRAKFATLALCYELHLEWRGGVIYSCNGCEALLDGVRLVCDECEEFELCELCAGSGGHCHSLRRVEPGDEQQQPQLTQPHQLTTQPQQPTAQPHQLTTQSQQPQQQQMSEQEKRRRNIEQVVAMVQHGSQCRDANCRRSECAQFKGLQQHRRLCTITSNNSNGSSSTITPSAGTAAGASSAGVCVKCHKLYQLMEICRRFAPLLQRAAQSGSGMSGSGGSAPTTHQTRLRQMADDRRRIEAVAAPVPVPIPAPLPPQMQTPVVVAAATAAPPAAIDHSANAAIIQSHMRLVKEQNPTMQQQECREHLQSFLDSNPQLKITYQWVLQRKVQSQQQQQQTRFRLNTTPQHQQPQQQQQQQQMLSQVRPQQQQQHPHMIQYRLPPAQHLSQQQQPVTTQIRFTTPQRPVTQFVIHRPQHQQQHSQQQQHQLSSFFQPQTQLQGAGPHYIVIPRGQSPQQYLTQQQQHHYHQQQQQQQFQPRPP